MRKNVRKYNVLPQKITVSDFMKMYAIETTYVYKKPPSPTALFCSMYFNVFALFSQILIIITQISAGTAFLVVVFMYAGTQRNNLRKY